MNYSIPTYRCFTAIINPINWQVMYLKEFVLIFLFSIFNVELAYPSTITEKESKEDSIGGTFTLWRMPEYCSTPEELSEFVDYTLLKTQELISFYDKGIVDSKGRNEIGYVTGISLGGYMGSGLVEFLPKYKWLILFLGQIAGYNLDYSKTSDPTQFQRISKVREMLDYYRKHPVEKEELYIYYCLYSASIFCEVIQWSPRIFPYRLIGIEWMFLTKEQAEEYPESLPVALETIDNAGSAIRRALFNILNKKTISELEKEATVERSNK